MATPACLSLPQVLQLVRYELGFTQHQIADRAFLRVEAYDALERGTGKPKAQELDRLMKWIPFLLPVLLGLPPTGPQAPMTRRLQECLNTLEQAAPDERAAELQRIRLELDWRDRQVQDVHADYEAPVMAVSANAWQRPQPRAHTVRPAAAPGAVQADSDHRRAKRPLKAWWTRAKSLLTST